MPRMPWLKHRRTIRRNRSRLGVWRLLLVSSKWRLRQPQLHYHLLKRHKTIWKAKLLKTWWQTYNRNTISRLRKWTKMMLEAALPKTLRAAQRRLNLNQSHRFQVPCLSQHPPLALWLNPCLRQQTPSVSHCSQALRTNLLQSRLWQRNSQKQSTKARLSQL